MIRVTAAARGDLRLIAAAIKRDAGVERADRITSRITASFRRLDLFPDMGRPGRVPGTRELVVPGLPYISVYARHPDRADILRVIHGAQLWPPDAQP